MTQEEKQLLLKDLCARLPYGVIIKSISGDDHGKAIDISYPQGTVAYNGINGCKYSEDFKPYLRPMSSMTKEEKYAYRHMLGATLNSEGKSIMFVYVEDFPTVIDWLLSHHFDYRDLIEMGLALEATEGMYKNE